MPAAGQTTVDFNDRFFDAILNSAGAKQLSRQATERALAAAQASAPVDTGDYRNGLHIEEVKRAHRTTYMVVGSDAKTLLVESQTGNLAKALKKART